jgi:hypothetical protein
MKSAALWLGQFLPLHWKIVHGFLVPQALTAPCLSPLPCQGDPHGGGTEHQDIFIERECMCPELSCRINFSFLPGTKYM